jgi:hypothetical protein
VRRCKGGDSTRIGIIKCLGYEGGGELELLRCSYVSTGNNQVNLCSPPCSRNMHLIIGGDVEGIIESIANINRPRLAKVWVAVQLTKHDY